MQELSSELAQHIIDRMGSTGQPPERGARFVNVATEEILRVFCEEYLQPLKKTRKNSTFKLIQAPFGGGKTHFLHCMRELAWSEDYVTCLVGLSPKECPFDRPLSIYREVALKLELPVTDLEEEPRQGLDCVLEAFAKTKIHGLGVKAFKAWIAEEFAQANIESRQFGRGVRAYLDAVADRRLDDRDILGDYLRGEKVALEDLEPFKIRERVDDKSAFRWLRSLAQCLSALAFPGLVLMFDEMDRNLSLSAGRRRAIGDNLRQMIDYCGQSALPGVIWCYAVPPEFMDNVVPEYPALAQRLKGVGSFSANSPMQPMIDLDRLDLDAALLFEQIGKRLLEIYQVAFETRFNLEIQHENISSLARELGAVSFESGTRRQFVKAVLSLIDQQRRQGERLLSFAELETVATGAKIQPELSLVGEVEF